MKTSKLAMVALCVGSALGPGAVGCSVESAPAPASDTSGADGGDTTAPDAGEEPNACELRAEEGECETCTRGSCCSVLEKYLGASDVARFDACAEPCDDDACMDGCAAASPRAGAAYDGLVGCQTGSCAEPCVCEAFDDDSRCLACVKVSCCSSLVPYALASDFEGFEACMAPCADRACADACIADFPTAGNAYAAYSDCALSACPAECE